MGLNISELIARSVSDTSAVLHLNCVPLLPSLASTGEFPNGSTLSGSH